MYNKISIIIWIEKYNISHLFKCFVKANFRQINYMNILKIISTLYKLSKP